MNTLDKALEDIRVCAKSFRIIHAMRGNDSCNSTESIPPSFLFKMKDYKKIIFDHEEDMKNRVSYVTNEKNGRTYKIFNCFLKKKNTWEVTMNSHYGISRRYFSTYRGAKKFVDTRTKRHPADWHMSPQ
jgi:hypothetical protein